MGGEGGVLGLVGRVRGTMAPRGGGQCGATKTPREENARKRWGLGARIPALWAWHLSILQCQGKEIFKKNGKIVLFRLFITRILIWKSGRNRGSFYFGGEGVGFPPSTPNAYTTDCLSSIINFSTEFFTYQYLAVIGKFLFGFLRWIVCVIV